jgi:glycosyltransferase involved in cell wall biosynthesis
VEVTNTLAVDFLTGFQRHTREIVRHLPGPDATGPLRVVPIVWCRSIRDFRRLTDAEAARLAGGVVPRPGTSIAPAPSGLRRALRPVTGSAPVAAARQLVARHRDPAGPLPLLRSLRVAPEPGSILFDLEAAWEDPLSRVDLLPRLASAGVTTTALIADVMPVQFPQWFRAGTVERFGPFIRAHLRRSAAFAWISRATERDSRELARSIGVPHELAGRVVTLGADAPGKGADQPLADVAGTRYLLCVGTLEPRKHQDLAIDVFDRLRDRRPDLALVLVGRRGWGVDDLVARIEAHPEHGRRLHWRGALADDELSTLYRHAFVALVPSRYEGFGVPVIEAVASGVPTISSDAGALPEAGGDLVEYAGPDDLDRWVALVERHLDDPAHHRAARARLVGHAPPSWAAAAEGVEAMLAEAAAGRR